MVEIGKKWFITKSTKPLYCKITFNFTPPYITRDGTTRSRGPIYTRLSEEKLRVTAILSWISSAVSDPDSRDSLLIPLLLPATLTHVNRAAAPYSCCCCVTTTHKSCTLSSQERLLTSAVHQGSRIPCQPLSVQSSSTMFYPVEEKNS